MDPPGLWIPRGGPRYWEALPTSIEQRAMSDPMTPSAPETLSREALGDDPLQAFQHWLSDAELDAGMRYPNAVTLSTVDAAGHPDGRIVLLKGVDDRGFLFFTNYGSAKGRALAVHPRGALTFYWDGMGRQVRARGPVERLSPEESDAYFASRPRVSRIGAWASEQSRELGGREVLNARVVEMEAIHPGDAIPRPPHWGGFVLRPEEVEFWQEGPFRLHDRILYRRSPSGWDSVRLFP